MFLHVGSQIAIWKGTIEAILDIKTIGMSKATKEFLAKKEKKRGVRYVGKKSHKSLILNSNEEIVLSPIETPTLRKRFERSFFK